MKRRLKMKRSKISSILLDELLEEMKERKEIDNMKKKELSFMTDDLLEKVEEVIDFIIYEFDEVEKDEYMKKYIEILFFMKYVLYGLQLK